MKHFALSEFFAGCSPSEISEALRKPELTENIFNMCRVLEEIRTLAKVPIIINSCYRDKKHNARVGGLFNSQHLEATACDIKRTPAVYEAVKTILADSDASKYVRQVIYYPTFIHVAVLSEKYHSYSLCRIIHN